MSFGKNKSNSKGSQTSSSTGQDTMSGTTNFNQSLTPTNPDWVSSLAQNLGGSVSTLAGTNPTSYIAGPTPLLQTAANSAGDLNGTPWAYNGASDVTRGVATSANPNIASNIAQFENPYTQNVVNSTLADFDHQAGLTRAQQALDLAGSGAFGGSGAALTQAATEDNLARARASTDAGIRSQGFNTALQGATNQSQLQQQQDALRLQAANQLANIGSEYGANQRANIATQDAAAQPIQAINQATAQSPIDFQSALSQLFSGTMPQLFQGQNQAGTQVQNSTEDQTGTSKGNTTGFGFKIGGK
jgi:hypothetical protein